MGGGWCVGEGELAWEDRTGGCQARQSVRQLTGAGEGEGKVSRVRGSSLGMQPPHSPGGEEGERRGKEPRVLASLPPAEKGQWGAAVDKKVPPQK